MADRHSTARSSILTVVVQHVAVLALLVGTVACGAHLPTAPSQAPAAPAAPLTLGLSGQSNAENVWPFLAADATVVGYAISSTPIECWAAAAPCWQQLEPTLHRRLDAFIWWQGENNYGPNDGAQDPALGMWEPFPGVYSAKLIDVLQRVRQTAGDPRLRLVIVRLWDPRLDAEQDRAMAALGNAVAVQTRDIGFGDHLHMTASQYQQLVPRILAAAR